jgi:hypothetical protein
MIRAKVRRAPFLWVVVWGHVKPDGSFFCPADGLTYTRWHPVKQ